MPLEIECCTGTPSMHLPREHFACLLVPHLIMNKTGAQYLRSSSNLLPNNSPTTVNILPSIAKNITRCRVLPTVINTYERKPSWHHVAGPKDCIVTGSRDARLQHRQFRHQRLHYQRFYHQHLQHQRLHRHILQYCSLKQLHIRYQFMQNSCHRLTLQRQQLQIQLLHH